MSEVIINGEYIRTVLSDFLDHPEQCGFNAYVVKKDEPKLKIMALDEKKNPNGKDFRTILREMFFELIRETFLHEDAEYADGKQLADNQNKYLIISQSGAFQPFSFLKYDGTVPDYTGRDLDDATGLAFQIRKGQQSIWLYQHLWGIMIPNKKKTGFVTKIQHFEDKIIFSEQRDPLLTIARKVDILVCGNCLITKNTNLLQKNFGFQDYIYQSAAQAVSSIMAIKLVSNSGKLTEYIGRGKTKYAKKMMRIATSKVLTLPKEKLIEKVTTLDRWRNKFQINDENEIVLNTFPDVENIIDLFDERYTRSDVTDTEYDTDVKSVAQPV